MAISSEWTTGEAFESSWSVAQIRAPFPDVVSALSKSRSYRDCRQTGPASEFCVPGDDFGPLVAYATSDADWTYLECIWGAISFAPLVRLSKNTATDLLVANYFEDPGAMAYGHFRNGQLVEQFMTVDPEWPDTRGLDGKEKKWKMNSAKTQCIFGERDFVLNIEKNQFVDWWNDVANSLSVNIPYRCWTSWKGDDIVCADIAEAPTLKDAHLFSAI